MTNPNGDKGKIFERGVVEHLRRYWPNAVRTLAGARDDRGDVGNVPFVVQCKNVKRFALSEWVDEAEQQAKNAGLTRFVVVIKRPRKSDPAESYALMPLWLAAELLQEDK